MTKTEKEAITKYLENYDYESYEAFYLYYKDLIDKAYEEKKSLRFRLTDKLDLFFIVHFSDFQECIDILVDEDYIYHMQCLFFKDSHFSEQKKIIFSYLEKELKRKKRNKFLLTALFYSSGILVFLLWSIVKHYFL